MPTKRIVGEARDAGPAPVYVEIGARRRELPTRTDEVNHSPSGFSWGYKGSGPAQLAYAILREFYTEEYARQYYKLFKNEVIADLHGDFELTDTQIDNALQQIEGRLKVQ